MNFEWSFERTMKELYMKHFECMIIYLTTAWTTEGSHWWQINITLIIKRHDPGVPQMFSPEIHITPVRNVHFVMFEVYVM